MRELLVGGAALWQDAALKAAHIEQQVGIVLAVDGHKAAAPLDAGDGARQPVLDVPEHRTAPETQTDTRCQRTGSKEVMMVSTR